jgi:hypothetical protein
LRKWILNFSNTYKYNTANKDGFRYGDVYSAYLVAGKRIDFEKGALLPYCRMSYENMLHDAVSHVLQGSSGGNLLLAGPGLDVNTKHFTAGISYHIPINQSLSGGLIEARPGFMVQLAKTF